MTTPFKACAHLGFQFNEFAGLERIHQAAKVGFLAAEWPAIYDFDRAAFMQAVKSHALTWPQVTLPLGKAGEKGITALSGREAEFESDLDQAISYALELDSPFIHPMSGVADLMDAATRQTYVCNLKLAVSSAKAHGLKVLVEVISPSTVTGYAMCDYELAQSVFEEVGNLYLLLDTYHAQLITDDVCTTIRRFDSKIGHVQVADVPRRNEPGTGDLDFESITQTLHSVGYSGWLGCEYKPKTATLDGLQLLKDKGWL